MRQASTNIAKYTVSNCLPSVSPSSKSPRLVEIVPVSETGARSWVLSKVVRSCLKFS